MWIFRRFAQHAKYMRYILNENLNGIICTLDGCTMKIDWVGKLAVRKMRLPGRTMKVSQPLDCNLTECSNVEFKNILRMKVFQPLDCNLTAM